MNTLQHKSFVLSFGVPEWSSKCEKLFTDGNLEWDPSPNKSNLEEKEIHLEEIWSDKKNKKVSNYG